MVIHLGLPLLTGSSSLPGSKRGPRLALPYLALLRAGFTVPRSVTAPGGALLPHRFTLTAARRGGLFSVALSRGHPHRTLSGALPCAARTFLDRLNLPRPSEPLRAAQCRNFFA